MWKPRPVWSLAATVMALAVVASFPVGLALAVSPCGEGYTPVPGGVCIKTVNASCAAGQRLAANGHCEIVQDRGPACPSGTSFVPGPTPQCGYPPKHLICPAGYNKVQVPPPLFIDCIGDPWKEVALWNTLGCPPWPVNYVNDRSGYDDKCVAPSPFGDVVTDVACPPPPPGGKVEKKVQPGRDACRIFVPNPPQRTNPIMQ